MHFLRIWLRAIVAAVLYGIVHDQITIRICLEYFTVWHPRIISSRNPTVLALVWGVVATWWVGAVLGIPLAIAARAGRAPKLTDRDLTKPLVVMFVVVGVLAAANGVRMYYSNPMQELAPGERGCDVDYAIHSMSCAPPHLTPSSTPPSSTSSS